MGKAVCGFADLDPDLHGMMAAWIQRPTRRKLGLAPRAHLKTSVWTIADTLRLIANDPNIRILIVNEVFRNASDMLQAIGSIAERSPMFRWLFPEVIPDFQNVVWNQEKLTFRRTKIGLKEATVEAIGVGGASTSRHYDRIKEDDLIGKEASESKLVMDKAIDQHKLSEALLSRPGQDPIDTYGTRWGRNDLTKWMLKNEPEGLDALTLSIRKPDGSPIWPSRFPPHVIAELRTKYGAAMFGLQFDNRVVGDGLSELNAKWLRYWKWGRPTEDGGQTVMIERPEHEGGPYSCDLSMLETFILVDAGLSHESSAARSAVVTVGLTGTKPFDIIVLDAWAERTPPKATLAKAEEKRVAWNPLTIGLEVVGAHMVFYYWALERYPTMPLRKLKTDTHTSKESRIRQVCAPYGEQGRIYVGRWMHDFLDEWESFPSKNATVDMLDAFAYGPQVWVPPSWSDLEGWEEDEEDEGVEQLSDGRDPHTGY